jgi:penicillin-binding protein 1A
MRPKTSVFGRLIRIGAFLGTSLAVLGGLAGLFAYGHFAKDLPGFESLRDYRPRLVSRVFAQDGQLVGEFYNEKRIVLPYAQLPDKLVRAFIASEDDRFFEHTGIDYLGILRAAWTNLKAGRVVQGGSTITQQVAKSLLVSDEGYESGTAKKFSRKIREAILARRLEAHLGKREIIEVYLNQIFLGNQAYGIEAAADNYFRKSASELTVAEIALLAGLPQAPSRYSPIMHPQRARERRTYVLRRMLENNLISDAEREEAEKELIVVYRAPTLSRDVAPHFVEHVRQMLVEQFGEDAVLNQGLRVFTTLDVERTRAAQDAIARHVRQVDKRQGYRGPLLHFDGDGERRRFLESYTKELKATGHSGPIQVGMVYAGLVEKIVAKTNHIVLRIGAEKAFLPLAVMRWARKVNPQVRYDSALLASIPKTFQVGDVLLVRGIPRESIKKDSLGRDFLESIADRPEVHLVALEQEPNLECAVLSEEVDNGYVYAMVGGFSFDRSEFNRTLQACRQPGSSFKPVIYTAALDLKGLTASTTILDAPVAFDDPDAQRRWKPSNFDVRFEGEVTLRTALKNSMNVPAIRLLDRVGLDHAITYARRLGIETELRPELGLALGASCVNMGELLGVYRLIANHGQKTPRRFITRTVDRDGKTLTDLGDYRDPWASLSQKLARAERLLGDPPKAIIDEKVAFVMTKLMRNVVEEGTGAGAKEVGVPIAGKTGTTNDSFDAWFIGFTPTIATATWVGYDDYVQPMGRYEQGGRAALPLWVSYMKRAIKKEPKRDFKAPEGIVFVRIDPKTGLRARDDSPAGVFEAFIEGTEPKDFVARAGDVDTRQFLLIDN